MNLGQAVAVCLYELVRDARIAGVSEKPALATSGEVERITTILCDLLGGSVYMDPRRAASTEERVRRMVHRLKLSARDTEGWLGILRQIAWTMRSKKNSPE